MYGRYQPYQQRNEPPRAAWVPYGIQRGIVVAGAGPFAAAQQQNRHYRNVFDRLVPAYRDNFRALNDPQHRRNNDIRQNPFANINQPGQGQNRRIQNGNGNNGGRGNGNNEGRGNGNNGGRGNGNNGGRGDGNNGGRGNGNNRGRDNGDNRGRENGNDGGRDDDEILNNNDIDNNGGDELPNLNDMQQSFPYNEVFNDMLFFMDKYEKEWLFCQKLKARLTEKDHIIASLEGFRGKDYSRQYGPGWIRNEVPRYGY